MQKEITKRVRLYGVAAILLALLLVSVCYQFGYIPHIPFPTTSAMATFGSSEELHDFLKSKSQPQGWYTYRDAQGGVSVFLSPSTNGVGPQALFDTNTKLGEALSKELSNLQHSTTNIQVSGVDEADSVKTDDHGYIYLIAGNNITILKGYPPENASIVSVIAFTDMSPLGIFVNGDRLTVLGAKYNVAQTLYNDVRWSYFTDTSTYAKIYDVSNRSQPELLKTYTTSGSYFNSRMIGEYVYLVASTPAYYTIEVLPGVTVDNINLPKIGSNGGSKDIAATEVYYSNSTDSSYMFTTIVAMNVQNATEEPNHETIMTGGASAMYVSMNNVYISYPASDKTSLYRVHIEDNTITPQAQGEVPGRILNQFSMDEYNNYFRTATQTSTNSTPRSNLFVLDMNLSIVGELLDIEVGESLDSARFINTRCYLSTSVVRIDPFFVVDMENVSAPQILGYLKIPGFTRYLHPYDENHLIGVGRDETNNVKVTLFDVSNVSAPKNISEYRFQADWSDTPVLTDHKAFLFDYSKDLLAFPVSMNYYSYDYYRMQQGLMVFKITLDEGLVLKGNVTHLEPETGTGDYNHFVKRAVYIENVLYTISDAKIKMNSLQDLAFIKEIEVG